MTYGYISLILGENMCHKKQPVRLQKVSEPWWFTEGKILIKQPNFWLFLIIAIIFGFLIFFAIKESTTFFVYNTGGI